MSGINISKSKITNRLGGKDNIELRDLLAEKLSPEGLEKEQARRAEETMALQVQSAKTADRQIV